MKHSLAILAACAALSLAACTGDDVASDTPKSYCPNVAVLQQASTLNSFLPGRSDIAGEMSTVKITGIAGSCVPVDNSDALAIRFKVGFSGVVGPAGSPASITVPYFVSISQDNTVFWKADHSITLNFSADTGTATATSESLLVKLPNTIPSASTDVLVGIQLTPEQLNAPAAQ